MAATKTQPKRTANGKFKPLDDELKLQLISLHAMGHTSTQISELLGVPLATCERYKKHMRTWIKELTEETKDVLGLVILRNVLKTFQTTSKILDATSNEKYIAGQNANDIAILYGVISDKALRVLEALEPSSAEDSEGGA